MISKMEMICKGRFSWAERNNYNLGLACIFIDACLREELEQLEFSQRSQAEQGMIERQHFLDRDLSSRGLMEGSSHSSIGTLSNSVQELIVVA